MIELIIELVEGVVFTVDLHLDLAFLSTQDDGLLAEPTDHVERTVRHAAQRQLLHVGGNAAFDDLPQFLGQRKEPIGRAQAIDPLMRPLMVVVLHPQPNSFPRLLKAVKLGAAQKLLPDCFPEPLDLAQRHRMMRLAAEVMHMVFLELMLEPRLAMPGGILPPVVREHLLRDAVLAHGGAVDLQHMLGRLAAEQIQPNHVPRVIIDEANQVGLLVPQPEGEDVGLPHLVGGRPLKETRLLGVLLRLLADFLDEVMCVQGAAHCLMAGR